MASPTIHTGYVTGLKKKNKSGVPNKLQGVKRRRKVSLNLYCQGKWDAIRFQKDAGGQVTPTCLNPIIRGENQAPKKGDHTLEKEGEGVRPTC